MPELPRPLVPIAGTPYPYKVEPCIFCRRPVILAETVNGRTMPIDPDIDPDGTAKLTPRAGKPPLVSIIGKVGDRFGKKLRVTHMATCPRRVTGRAA